MRKRFIKILAAGIFMLGTGASEKIFADVGISINPGSWNAGTGGSGSYISWNSGTPAGGGYFSVANTGTQNVNLKVRATNTQNWTLSPGTGLNQFSLKWGQTAAAGVQPVWNTISSTDSVIPVPLSPAADYKFDLKFQSPTQVEPPDLSAPQQTSLTVTADPAPLLPSAYTITGEWQVATSSAVSMIGIDSQNNLWLLFVYEPYGNATATVKKISPDGTVLHESLVPVACYQGEISNNIGENSMNDIDSNGNILLLMRTRVCKLDPSGNLLGLYYTPGCTSVDACEDPLGYLSAGANGYVYFAHSASLKVTMDPLTTPFSTIGYNSFGYPNLEGVNTLQVTNESVYLTTNQGELYEFGLEGSLKRMISNLYSDTWPDIGQTAKDPFGNLLAVGTTEMGRRLVRLEGTLFKTLAILEGVASGGMAVDSTGKIYFSQDDGRISILSPQY